MGAVFEPTVTLGNLIGIGVNIVVLGLPAIWWASKVSQVVKDMRGDIGEVKDNMITRHEVATLKESADREHEDMRRAQEQADQAIRREINGIVRGRQ